jgi:hypothetical protein
VLGVQPIERGHCCRGGRAIPQPSQQPCSGHWFCQSNVDCNVHIACQSAFQRVRWTRGYEEDIAILAALQKARRRQSTRSAHGAERWLNGLTHSHSMRAGAGCPAALQDPCSQGAGTHLAWQPGLVNSPAGGSSAAVRSGSAEASARCDQASRKCCHATAQCPPICAGMCRTH